MMILLAFFSIGFAAACAGCGYLYARMRAAEIVASAETKNANELASWIKEAREACIWHDKNLDAMILKKRISDPEP